MSDMQNTVVGLKAQACPGGGWNGMPTELEGRATVADCLAHGVCGCIYGDAAQHIERLRGEASYLTDAVIQTLRQEIERLQAALRTARDQIDRNAYGRTTALAIIDDAILQQEDKA